MCPQCERRARAKEPEPEAGYLERYHAAEPRVSPDIIKQITTFPANNQATLLFLQRRYCKIHFVERKC